MLRFSTCGFFMWTALGVAAGCAPAKSPEQTEVAFTSGPDWESYERNEDGTRGTLIGAARAVCLSPNAPASCPANAVSFGTDGSGWSADISSIPEAVWVWRGDVVAEASADNSVLLEKTFVVGANPAGSISIAADDFAEVFVNGESVGTTGSTTDGGLAAASQSTLTTLDLTPALKEGENTLSVVAINGPFQCRPDACAYTNAPAGVVFGGSLSY